MGLYRMYGSTIVFGWKKVRGKIPQIGSQPELIFTLIDLKQSFISAASSHTSNH